LDELAELDCASVSITTDDGSRGQAGFTTQAAEKLLDRFGYGQVFACGPEPMMRGIASLAKENDAPCQVSFERMMTCGFGACSTCNVAMRAGGYKSCCTDGPVFDAEEVLW
jgi:dihydroorotate dehydrogenase electron transfer subunit